MNRSMRTLLPVLAAILLAGGCDSTNGIGPDNQLEVTSATDSFQLQVTALERVTETLSYSWENTGPQATIDISQAITAGSALLTLTDSEGTVVYQEDIRDDSDGTTTVGVAGSWMIRVEIVDVTGTFNFRAQRTT